MSITENPVWHGVVIHHSAGPDYELADMPAIRRYHTAPKPLGKGWSDIGYHFVVEQVGKGEVEVLKGRPLFKVGAHAFGYNRTHIGICLVGNYMEKPPSVAMLDRTAALVHELYNQSLPSSKLSMPLDHLVLPHRQIGSTLCPGKSFPFHELLVKISQRTHVPVHGF